MSSSAASMLEIDFQTLGSTLLTALAVLLLLAAPIAFLLMFYVRVDEEGRWWVRSQYGAYRMRLRTQLWLLVMCALLFLLVYLGSKLMGGHGFPA